MSSLACSSSPNGVANDAAAGAGGTAVGGAAGVAGAQGGLGGGISGNVGPTGAGGMGERPTTCPSPGGDGSYRCPSGSDAVACDLPAAWLVRLLQSGDSVYLLVSNRRLFEVTSTGIQPVLSFENDVDRILFDDPYIYYTSLGGSLTRRHLRQNDAPELIWDCFTAGVVSNILANATHIFFSTDRCDIPGTFRLDKSSLMPTTTVNRAYPNQPLVAVDDAHLYFAIDSGTLGVADDVDSGCSCVCAPGPAPPRPDGLPMNIGYQCISSVGTRDDGAGTFTPEYVRDCQRSVTVLRETLASITTVRTDADSLYVEDWQLLQRVPKDGGQPTVLLGPGAGGPLEGWSGGAFTVDDAYIYSYVALLDAQYTPTQGQLVRLAKDGSTATTLATTAASEVTDFARDVVSTTDSVYYTFGDSCSTQLRRVSKPPPGQ
jgi:hypothetical protein